MTFELLDAQSDDLGHGRFDAAFSRFGVMFFSDPVAAFANIRRSFGKNQWSFGICMLATSQPKPMDAGTA